MSIESIESMGLLWRCKWLQMAEEAEEASRPIQGVQRVYICDCVITLYPIRKLLAKSDINLQSMCVDIKSYQVNGQLACARGFGE
jgi:hypothetical protein